MYEQLLNMKIRLPTDIDIMDALSDGKRNTAANLAYLIDKERAYINTRLPVLADYGLVERVGPAPNSGLYVITSEGVSLLDTVREKQSEGTELRPAVDEALEEMEF